MSRFLAGLIVGLMMVPASAHYVNEPAHREERHERIVERVCKRPHHWDHNHGISVMPEACD